MSLPSGWALATLADLIGPHGVLTDGDWVETKDQDPSGDVRLIQLADVGDGEYRNRSARFLTSDKARLLKCTFLKRGDILVARMPDPLGRTCLFPGDAKPCVTVVDVCVVRAGDPGPDHRWLMHCLNAPQFRSAVAGLQSGSTRKRISKKNLSALRIPVPPLAEQRRIAGAIEEHLSRLNAASASLRHAVTRTAVYRSSIINAACNGDLARQLGLPFAHETRQLGDLLERIEAGRSFKCEERQPRESELGVVKVSAVTWGEFDPSESKTVKDPARFDKRFLIRQGDLLFSRANTLQLVGACVIVKNQPKALMLSDKILRLVPKPEVSSTWLLLCLRSRIGRMAIERLSTGNQESMRNIGQDRIRQIPIPVVPMAIADAVVAEVDARLSGIDAVAGDIQAAILRAQQLRESILRAAFEGRLVPQRSDDESAIALVERMRVTRFVAPKTKTHNRSSA